MSSARTTPEGSTAAIGSLRSEAVIVPSTVISRRSFGVVLQAAGTLAATAVKGAWTSALLAAAGTIAAITQALKATAGALTGTAAIASPAPRKDQHETAALAATATIASPAPLKAALSAAAFAETAAITVAQRAVSCQVANSNGDRVVNSDGSVAIDYQLA